MGGEVRPVRIRRRAGTIGGRAGERSALLPFRVSLDQEGTRRENQEGLTTTQPEPLSMGASPGSDSRTWHPRSGQMGHASFIAESFGGCDDGGVAGGQQAGEECAESEERGGCEQTACGKGVLHPVGEDGAEKTVKGKTDDYACGHADERNARGNPQDVLARRAERQPDTEFRSALRYAVSDQAEDAHQ